ncbi:hypothetical protein [Persephonella sp.]
MIQETIFSPISIFILNENTDEFVSLIKKDLYHERGIIFNDKDSLNIQKITKIGVVISDFEEDWQVKKTENIITKLLEKDMRLFCVSTGKIPEKIKISSYSSEEVAIDKIPIFIKILQAFAYPPIKSMVCTDITDLLNLLDKNRGRVNIFNYQLPSTNKKEFENFLYKNIKLKPRKLIAVIDMSFENSYSDGEEIIGRCKEVLKPQRILFNICLMEDFKDYQMKVSLVCISN